jgi:uncharacterized protein
MENAPFHLSLPCYDTKRTREFYVDKLGFTSGRSKDGWVDINMAGCQLTFIKAVHWKFPNKYYQFEDIVLPAFHFGVLLDKENWDSMRSLCNELDLDNEEPVVFLKGQPGEHRSFFVEDPNEYVIEFKCFNNEDEAFTS